MKRILIIFFIFLSLPGMAQEHRSYMQGDTLYYTADNELCTADQAASYGIVQLVDEEENIATIRLYDINTNLLQAVERRVAMGEHQGKYNGKQLYFSEDAKVEMMKIYALYFHKNGHATSRMMQETLMYPNGSVMDEVKMAYPVGKMSTYTRKCFTEEGWLEYEEEMNSTGKVSSTYYNKKGKVTNRPKHKISPYMTMPYYPGGLEKLMNFLSSNVHYPPVAQQNRIQGRVVCRFVVDKDGKISDVEVVKSAGDTSLDSEAKRVIQAMPKWYPGTRRGKPIRVKYTLPINFKLQ